MVNAEAINLPRGRRTSLRRAKHATNANIFRPAIALRGRTRRRIARASGRGSRLAPRDAGVKVMFVCAFAVLRRVVVGWKMIMGGHENQGETTPQLYCNSSALGRAGSASAKQQRSAASWLWRPRSR